MTEAQLLKKEYNRRYRERHPDRVKMSRKKWNDAHLDRRRNQTRSKEKVNLLARLWRQQYPERVLEANRKFRKRKKEAVIERSLREQNGSCAICKKPFLRTPHQDHCHKTGRQRGLLCGACNMGIGHFNDDIQVLKSAIEYLERFNAL